MVRAVRPHPPHHMKFTQSLIALALAVAGLQACDNISEDQRFEGPVTIEAKKNVLIEDFTGQNCLNCPIAAEAVKAMQDAYGADRVISVAIHGGSLSVNENSSTIGLANAQGEQYNKDWKVEAWPSGLIDRSGSLMDDPKQWTAPVVARFSLAPKADIVINDVSYDAATKQMTVNVTVSSEEGANGKLQVWLTESNLTRTQRMPDGSYNRDYVHNHVFRASVNDLYGDAITLEAGQSEQKSYSYTLQTEASGKGKGWVPENMAVVVFYYNDADGVMQVRDHKLIGGE